MTVAELLEASREAHGEYRRLAGTVNTDGSIKQDPNPVSALAAITQARASRVKADKADPAHLDSAWALDVKASHEQLMAFYDEHIPKRTERLEKFAEAQRIARAVAAAKQVLR